MDFIFGFFFLQSSGMVRRVRWDFMASFKAFFKNLAKEGSQYRGLILRTLLCWGIGLFALSADESNYDARFQVRGDQPTSPKIVLITLSPSDFFRVYGVRSNSFINLSEITDITDSFFWDLNIWRKLLSKVLHEEPQAVGVTLWFGDNIGSPQIPEVDRKLFLDKKITWATSITNIERMQNPLFAKPDLSNIGRMDLRRDDDGLVRRIFAAGGSVPHMVERITNKSLPRTTHGLAINFRGAPRVFAKYSLNDILNDELPPGALKGKIILIGAEGASAGKFQTPVGALSRSETIAQILDNHLENRWIKRLPFWAYGIFLLSLTCLAVFLITTYPQSVVLLFFLWIGTLCGAISIWAFDTYALWFPALSPFVLLLATWIVFIGYQATKVERLNSALKQEQRYLAELEQLKNNFVSLISHDLKTPIAKIQAVVIRMKQKNKENEFQEEFDSLLASSDELNRYIQSILKVLRVESRDFRLHRVVSDINEVIGEALGSLQPLASHKGIQIHQDLEPLFSSEFDVTLIKEVIINILENAIKYTPSGGHIHLESREIENKIHVKISDTGPGIAPDELDKVWQKFVRGKDQDLKTKGSGLGLYLVKYFIELHGGQVSLQSQLGKGSTISFWLPVSSERDNEEQDVI